MGRHAELRWVVQAATAVSWAVMAMAGVAALGLHLVGADGYARLGPLTAAVVALGAGGSIAPTGSAELFGATGAAGTRLGLDIMPLGVALAGAAVLGRLFVRPLLGRTVLELRELGVRAAAAVVCFLAVLGLVSWVGEDTVTLDIGSLAGGGSGGGLPGGLGGLGDLLDPGKLGGALGGALEGAARPSVAVDYSVRTAPTLLAGLVWVLVVLLLALLCSRRVPLPLGRERLDRTVRPVASALWTVLLVATLAGVGTSVVLPLTEGAGPAAAVGGALLAVPNGIGPAAAVALGVPVSAQATGALPDVLPAPLDALLKVGTVQDLTLPRLMELDGSLWLLPVAVGLLLLLAGVLAAVRTPQPDGDGRPAQPVHAALTAAGRLGVAFAVALPAVLALCAVAVRAQVSVLGFDVFGTAATLQGNLPLAALYGLVWGAVAGFAGSLLVDRFAAAKRPAAPAGPGSRPGGSPPGEPAPYDSLPRHTAPGSGGPAPANPYLTGGDSRPYGGFNPYSDGPGVMPPPPPPFPMPPLPPQPPDREAGG